MEGGRNRGNARKTPRVVLGNPGDPQGLARALDDYLEWLASRNYAASTVSTRRQQLERLVGWLDERGVGRPADVTRPILQRFQRWLFLYRKPSGVHAGQPLSFGLQAETLSACKGLFRWLARENRILYNPASDLDMPKVEQRLPQQPLSTAQVEQVLAVPNLDTWTGLRDRSLMEVLYATGVRRFELAGLKVWDVNLDRQTLWVRQGKGRKDRVVPISERALAWVDLYQREVRPGLVVEPDDGFLFLNYLGEAMGLHTLCALVRGYVRRSGVAQGGGCHLFRHTMATMMLEGGADVRHVQEMLGHSNIASTQIYTHVSIAQLQRVYATTHPAARLRGQRGEAERTEARRVVTAAELLAALADEGDADDDGLPVAG